MCKTKREIRKKALFNGIREITAEKERNMRMKKRDFEFGIWMTKNFIPKIMIDLKKNDSI